MFSKVLRAVLDSILSLTLYEMIRASQDFEDILVTLNERRSWTIDAYQSCFNISLARYNTFATLCTLSFLAMAETLHLRYGRLSPDQLRAHVHAIGHGTFAIVNAIPDLGVIIIRTVEIFATAESPAVAVCLTLLSALPAVVIPLVIHVVKLLKGWARKYRRKDSGGEEEGINGGTGENTPA